MSSRVRNLYLLINVLGHFHASLNECIFANLADLLGRSCLQQSFEYHRLYDPWLYQGQPDKVKPWIRIQPKDSRSAFVNLVGGTPENRLAYRGRFLDLSVLGWALRNQHMTLDGFLDSFGLKGKLKHEPSGRVTREELSYGRRDVERTVALLNAMKREYDGFPLELPPEQITLTGVPRAAAYLLTSRCLSRFGMLWTYSPPGGNSFKLT